MERSLGRVSGLVVLRWLVEALVVRLSGCEDVVMELLMEMLKLFCGFMGWD